MPQKTRTPERPDVVLGLLTSVERDGTQSQRRLATELDVALGLVNAYLKRCVKKGLVKVKTVPAHRYAYYLTPKGFAVKSRLTAQYLSHSFSFFRQARQDCTETFAIARAHGWKRVVLAGVSDLSEICAICAPESGIEIVAIVDRAGGQDRLIDIPVVDSYSAVSKEFDGVVISKLSNLDELYLAVVKEFGAGCVLVPKLLRLNALQHIEPARSANSLHHDQARLRPGDAL
jgi:DNA-binding MarR family transcriptional regulator